MQWKHRESCSRGVGEWVNIMGHALWEWTTAVWSFIPSSHSATDVCSWSSLDNTTIVKLRLQSPVLKFRIMRVNFSASWIFQGWITHFVLALWTQVCFFANDSCKPNFIFEFHGMLLGYTYYYYSLFLLENYWCILSSSSQCQTALLNYSFKHFVGKMVCVSMKDSWTTCSFESDLCSESLEPV